MDDMTSSEPADARAVFLDKDGTLVPGLPHGSDPDLLELLPRVGEGLRQLQDAGYLLIVVSNEPGVALGRFPASALTLVEARLDELLAPYGVVISGYFWCIHHPSGARVVGATACTCRKPRPGLLLDAAGTQGIALDQSWMIGDIPGRRRGRCSRRLSRRARRSRWRDTLARRTRAHAERDRLRLCRCRRVHRRRPAKMSASRPA
jgi:histidinol-phosphate phosphatase family protein